MLKYYGKSLNGKPVAVIELVNTASGTKEIIIEDKYANIKQFNIANNTYYSEENVKTEWKVLKIIDEKPDGFRILNKEFYEVNNIQYFNRYFERYNSILFIDDYLNGKVYDDILNDKESDYYKAAYNVLGDKLDTVLTAIGMQTFTNYNMKYLVYVNGMSNLGKDVFQNALSIMFSSQHFLSESFIDNDRDPDLHNKYIHVMNETNITSDDFQRFNSYTGAGNTNLNINQKGKKKEDADLSGYNCFVFNNDRDILIKANSGMDLIKAFENRCLYIERQKNVKELSEVLEGRNINVAEYAGWIAKYIYSKLNSMTDKDKSDFYKNFINIIRSTTLDLKSKYIYKDTSILFEGFIKMISDISLEEDYEEKIRLCKDMLESDYYFNLYSTAKSKGYKDNFLDIFSPEATSSNYKYKTLTWGILKMMAKDFGYNNTLKEKDFFTSKPGTGSAVISKSVIECASSTLDIENRDEDTLVTQTFEEAFSKSKDKKLNNSNDPLNMF